MLTKIKLNAPFTAKLLMSSIRDGNPQYRFWQAGAGYDRNLFTPEAIHTSIEYIHANPVRRGLCECALDWAWSSARWYADLDSVFEVDRCESMVMR